MFGIHGMLELCHSGKKATIRRVAVRETGVSRHHGGPIQWPSETPRTPRHYGTEGAEGRLQLLSHYAARTVVDVIFSNRESRTILSGK